MSTWQDTAHLEARRAANQARYYGHLTDDAGRRSPRMGNVPGVTSSRVYLAGNGLRVTLAWPKRPWATSVHGRAKYSHRPRFIFLVWRGGRVVLSDVRFLCGGHSTTALVEHEPTLKQCPKCNVALMGYDAAADALSDVRVRDQA